MLSEKTIKATLREQTGTRNSKRLRKNYKQIPAVIYIKNEHSVLIYIDHNKFDCFLKNKKNYHETIKIETNDQAYNVKIKEIQYHQYKPMILHIDFKLI